MSLIDWDLECGKNQIKNYEILKGLGIKTIRDYGYTSCAKAYLGDINKFKLEKATRKLLEFYSAGLIR